MEIILQLQSVRSAPLDFVMRVGSFFGFEFFLFLVPLLAWWGDKRYQKLGIQLFVFLLAIFYLVSVLKVGFARPRPLVVNQAIKSMTSNQLEKIEFSFPSGHAWGAMSFFFLAKSFQKVTYWIGAAFMAVFTIFSRVYFGVHYPHDTLAGMICGIILVIAFSFVEQSLELLFSSYVNHEERRSKRKKVKGFLTDKTNLISFLLLIVTLSITLLLDQVERKRQQGLAFVPFCLLGVILARPFFIHIQCNSIKYRVIRFAAGVPIILLVLALYLISHQLLRHVVAMFVGVLIFAIIPRIFVKLNLISKM